MKLLLAFALMPSLVYGGTQISVNKNHDVAVLKSSLEGAGFTVKFNHVYSVSKNGGENMVMSSKVRFQQTLSADQTTTVKGIIAAHTGPKTRRTKNLDRFQVLLGKWDAKNITAAEKDELLFTAMRMLNKLLARMNK